MSVQPAQFLDLRPQAVHFRNCFRELHETARKTAKALTDSGFRTKATPARTLQEEEKRTKLFLMNHFSARILRGTERKDQELTARTLNNLLETNRVDLELARKFAQYSGWDLEHESTVLPTGTQGIRITRLTPTAPFPWETSLASQVPLAALAAEVPPLSTLSQPSAPAQGPSTRQQREALQDRHYENLMSVAERLAQLLSPDGTRENYYYVLLRDAFTDWILEGEHAEEGVLESLFPALNELVGDSERRDLVRASIYYLGYRFAENPLAPNESFRTPPYGLVKQSDPLELDSLLKPLTFLNPTQPAPVQPATAAAAAALRAATTTASAPPKAAPSTQQQREELYAQHLENSERVANRVAALKFPNNLTNAQQYSLRLRQSFENWMLSGIHPGKVSTSLSELAKSSQGENRELYNACLYYLGCKFVPNRPPTPGYYLVKQRDPSELDSLLQSLTFFNLTKPAPTQPTAAATPAVAQAPSGAPSRPIIPNPEEMRKTQVARQVATVIARFQGKPENENEIFERCLKMFRHKGTQETNLAVQFFAAMLYQESQGLLADEFKALCSLKK